MDSLGLSPPASLCLDGNLAENWRKWRRGFENYLTAVNLVAEPANAAGVFPAGNGPIWLRQIAILRHCIGEESVELLDQFEFDAAANPPENSNRLPDVLGKFEAYFNPRRNRLYEWYTFWSLSQAEGEPIDMFVKRMRTQAARCEFGDMKEMMMLCRCAFGISNLRLKEKLLQDPEITLTRAVELIRASEVTKSQLENISGAKAVNEVRTEADAKSVNLVTERATAPKPAPRKVKCTYCGYEHQRGKCPAYGQTCRGCGRKNHFEKVCPRKKVDTIVSSTASVNDLFIGLIEDSDESRASWTKEYTVANGERTAKVNFKIDTGAEANVLPLAVAAQLQVDILPSTAGLTSYSRHRIKNIGKAQLHLRSNDTDQGPVWFELVEGEYPAILGQASSVELGVVRRVDSIKTESILEEFSDCFEGIGCLKRNHKIRVNPEVRPTVNRARRIPLSLEGKVKEELDKMEASGIITRVDQPTEWVNSMVVVEKKNHEVRICLDPRELNKAILREHHHIPTLDDIAHRFAGKKVFTILDMKHGYWHVPLDEESRLLTTFSTPFGRYSFNRLPFGVNSAAEVFEKRVEEVFGDLNVAIYFDDLIVAGKDQDEHDANLRKLLTRARENNVRFNRDKVQLNQNEVTYLGHIVSAEGLKPDPEKVKAITEMPDPADKLGVQRLLGSLNYLRGFIPNISQVTQPLRMLLKADSAWVWDAEQKQAMTTIKDLLTRAPVLKYFDIDKQTTLQADSSKSGLGAVLLQEGHPVAYASRALSEAEQNYPQIDKELLAIVFGCERFHSYVYGRAVDVQTDHNPLVTIVKKELHKASPRLQKLLLRLLKYDINRISYVPGKYLYLADTLSRAYIGDETGELEEDVVVVHSIQLHAEAKESLYKAYEQDETMSHLKSVIYDGWKWSSKQQSPPTLHPYWNVRDELHVKDGLVYRGEQLMIPTSIRREYLGKIHQGHLGAEKCLERARQGIYWPGISAEIREMVARCAICQRFANHQQKEPLMPHEVPSLPWNKVAMDIMEFRAKSYLVVVDFYSHFPELRVMKNKRSEDVISALKSIFAVHGTPTEIVADNMPFSSWSMHGFANEWGFNITTSSPNYPRSNGMAERYVQTIKKFLKKADETDGDLYAALLAYRQTPITGLPYSPAELLFNRIIRGPLPLTGHQLAPRIPDARDLMLERQGAQKKAHDVHARHCDPLIEGDEVFVRTDKQHEWLPGKVIRRHGQPRSYIVDTGTSHVRRNRVHLKRNRTDAEVIDRSEQDVPTLLETRPREPQVTPPGPENTDPPTPRRSLRENKGTLPSHFSDYIMQ